MKLVLEYLSESDLACHLDEHERHGAMLVAFGVTAPPVTQYHRVPVLLLAGAADVDGEAEVLQVFPDGRWVIRLGDSAAARARVADAPLTEAPVPPVASCVADDWTPASAAVEPAADPAAPPPDLDAPDADLPEEEPSGASGTSGPAYRVSLGAASWSIEKLQAEWDGLPVAEKVRVARHGGRAARIHVLKGLDRTLHAHVLSNPKISPEEVAMMAAMPQLDPAALKRIATSSEWLRHTVVVRNLVTNPKMPLPLVLPLLRHLPLDELRRLGRSGQVRASLKQEIVKRIDRG